MSWPWISKRRSGLWWFQCQISPTSLDIWMLGPQTAALFFWLLKLWEAGSLSGRSGTLDGESWNVEPGFASYLLSASLPTLMWTNTCGKAVPAWWTVSFEPRAQRNWVAADTARQHERVPNGNGTVLGGNEQLSISTVVMPGAFDLTFRITWKVNIWVCRWGVILIS